MRSRVSGSSCYSLTLPTLLVLTAIVAVFITPSQAGDVQSDVNNFLSNKAGSKVCLGDICNDSSAFHFYECCGKLYNECCFRLQNWVWIVLIVIGICFLFGFVGSLIKCICCCDRN
uniref:Uncharacterized protein n=1 Tax=Ditylenchus dipsaci TaxID=166011 RepID=A0A915CX37_9BILA